MEYDDSYDNYDLPSRKRFVPSALKGVVSTSASSPSPNRYRTKSKSKPWQVDRSSWKEQLKVRKTVFDTLAVEEHEDDVIEEKKSTDDRDELMAMSSHDEISIGMMSTTAEPRLRPALSEPAEYYGSGDEMEFAATASELARNASLLARSAADSSQEAGNALLRFRTCLQHQQPTFVEDPPNEQETWKSAAVQGAEEGEILCESIMGRSHSSYDADVLELSSIDEDEDEDEDNEEVEGAAASPINLEDPSWDESLHRDSDVDEPPSLETAQTRRSSLIIRQTPAGKLEAYTVQSCKSLLMDDTPSSDPLQRARKSLVLSHMAGRVQELYTQHHHSIEAMGTGEARNNNNNNNNNNKKTGVDMYQQIRTVVMEELSKEVGHISTEHHHCVESCLDELERDAKQGDDEGKTVVQSPMEQTDNELPVRQADGDQEEVETAVNPEESLDVDDEAKESENKIPSLTKDSKVPGEVAKGGISPRSSLEGETLAENVENEQSGPAETEPIIDEDSEAMHAAEDAVEPTPAVRENETQSDLAWDANVGNLPAITEEVRTKSLDEDDNQAMTNVEATTAASTEVESTEALTFVEANAKAHSTEASHVAKAEEENLANVEALDEGEMVLSLGLSTVDTDAVSVDNEKPSEQAPDNEESMEIETPVPLLEENDKSMLDSPVKETVASTDKVSVETERPGEVVLLAVNVEDESEVCDTFPASKAEEEVTIDNMKDTEHSGDARFISQDAQETSAADEPCDEAPNNENGSEPAPLETIDQVELESPTTEEPDSVGPIRAETECSNQLVPSSVSKDGAGKEAENSLPMHPVQEETVVVDDKTRVEDEKDASPNSQDNPEVLVGDRPCEKLTNAASLPVTGEEKPPVEIEEKTNEQPRKEQEQEELEVGKPKKGKKRESLKSKKWKDRLQAKKGLKHQDTQSTEQSTDSGQEFIDVAPSPGVTETKVGEEKQAIIADEAVLPPRQEGTDTQTEGSSLQIQGRTEKECADSLVLSVQPPAESSSPKLEGKAAAAAGFESFLPPTSSTGDKLALAIDDDEADIDAAGKPRKKRDSLKGKKWKERLGRRRSSLVGSDDKTKDDDSPTLPVDEVPVGIFTAEGLSSPANSEGKSKKWKDRLAKKRNSKGEEEKVHCEEYRLEEEATSAKDEEEFEKKPEQATPEKPTLQISPTDQKESGSKAPDVAIVKPKVEEPLQPSKTQSNENSTKVNALRDQLRTSFMAFDALLDPTAATNKDDESIYTEVTINTGLPSSGIPPKIKDASVGGGDAGDQSFTEVTVGRATATKSRQEGKNRQEQLKVESSLHMRNLLSSRMFADDFDTNPLQQDDYCEHATHATVTVRSDFDDDMTQITFDQSFLGHGFDGNDLDKKHRNEEDTYGFHDAIDDQHESVPSFTNLPNTSTHSASSQRSFGKQNSRGSESSVVSERSKQRIAVVLRKDIWNRDLTVVQAALFELGREAGAGPSRRANIVRFGGVMAIIRAMDMHPINEHIQVAACDALVEMAIDPDTQVAICEVGGVSAISKAMKEHAGQIELQSAACAALASITRPLESHEASAYTVVESDDAVQALLVSMNRYKDHPRIQAKAFRSLANLCMQNQDRLLEFSKAGGIITMTMALQLPWESLQEQHEAVSSLSMILRCLVDLQRTNQEKPKNELEPTSLEPEMSKQGATQSGNGSRSVPSTEGTDFTDEDQTKKSNKDKSSPEVLEDKEDSSEKSRDTSSSPDVGIDNEDASVKSKVSSTPDVPVEEGREECVIQ
jgi:mRNA-degrading endonuclease toxin of MazEF toxin-antitoxin module